MHTGQSGCIAMANMYLPRLRVGQSSAFLFINLCSVL
jgi:hypothetical protein